MCEILKCKTYKVEMAVSSAREDPLKGKWHGEMIHLNERFSKVMVDNTAR